ncbi:MAG: hypothetical protein AAF411_20955 [Myxococcota bacterium]
MPRQPLVPENTRVIGFIRPDDTRRIAWIFLLAFPTVVGAMLVGYGYGRLDAVDPVGIYDGFSEPRPEPDAAHEELVQAVGARSSVDVPSPALEPSAAERRLRDPEPPSSDDAWIGWLEFAVGFVLIAAGPLGAIVLLRRVWMRDEWVLLRDDALVVQAIDGDRTLPWYDVEKVRFDEDVGKVAFELRSGEPAFLLPDRFDGGDARETAERLETMRRKSSWGLL